MVDAAATDCSRGCCSCRARLQLLPMSLQQLLRLLPPQPPLHHLHVVVRYTNYYQTAALTERLKPLLDPHARVVFVASGAGTGAYEACTPAMQVIQSPRRSPMSPAFRLISIESCQLIGGHGDFQGRIQRAGKVELDAIGMEFVERVEAGMAEGAPAWSTTDEPDRSGFPPNCCTLLGPFPPSARPFTQSVLHPPSVLSTHRLAFLLPSRQITAPPSPHCRPLAALSAEPPCDKPLTADGKHPQQTLVLHRFLSNSLILLHPAEFRPLQTACRSAC